MKTDIVFVLKRYIDITLIIEFQQEEKDGKKNILCWKNREMAIKYAEDNFESGTSYSVISKTIEQIEDIIESVKKKFANNKLFIDRLGYRIVE